MLSTHLAELRATGRNDPIAIAYRGELANTILIGRAAVQRLKEVA